MQVIRREIATCEFVVADLTNFNANVVYEVGLAHAIGKRVLFICELEYKKVKTLLFDLKDYEVLFYSPYQLAKFDHEFSNEIKGFIKGSHTMHIFCRLFVDHGADWTWCSVQQTFIDSRSRKLPESFRISDADAHRIERAVAVDDPVALQEAVNAIRSRVVHLHSGHD